MVAYRSRRIVRSEDTGGVFSKIASRANRWIVIDDGRSANFHAAISSQDTSVSICGLRRGWMSAAALRLLFF
jgi:hypothetical protein